MQLNFFLGVIFGSIGLGYFMYGKKQKMTVPLVCGLVLMIYPYFIESTTLLSVIGVVISISALFSTLLKIKNSPYGEFFNPLKLIGFSLIHPLQFQFQVG